MKYQVKLTKEEVYLIHTIRTQKWGKIEITLHNGIPEVIEIRKTKKPRLIDNEELTKIIKFL